MVRDCVYQNRQEKQNHLKLDVCWTLCKRGSSTGITPIINLLFGTSKMYCCFIGFHHLCCLEVKKYNAN